MLNSNTFKKLDLLSSPIVISEAAWLETVYIRNFLYTELHQRLNVLLETTYREVTLLPEGRRPRCIDYGLYRFEPCGKRTERVWLDLRLWIEYQDGVPVLLRVALRNE